MEITEHDSKPDRWHVTSDSGNTYTVQLRNMLSASGSLYFRWECDCPSHYECKHIRAVKAYIEPVDDQAGERIY